MSSGSTGTQRNAPVTRSLHPTLTKLVLAAVGVSIGISCLVWMTTDQSHTKPPEHKVVWQRRSELDERRRIAKMVTEGTIVPQEPPENLAVRGNGLSAAERRLDRIRERIDGMLEIVKRCDQMQSNDEGKRVASSPEAIEKYSAIKGAIRLSDLDQLSTELGKLESAVERTRNYEERLPDEQAWQELEKATSKAFASFRDVGRMLDLLVSKSPAASAGAATLKDVLERREEERATDLTGRLTDVRKQTKEEVEAEMKSFEQQIGDLEAETKRMEAKAAVDKEEDRIKRVALQQEHEGEVRKQQAGMERLRKQFDIDYPRFEK